ncbi:lytic transglycosylase domain-containing protein [Thalassotalea psychrophila]|uniref:Lytic transglycosylase domain-containing protein n=1 Tax=Thalassotalea psychrophila TaxID=3065647 RepID=A0ABY9TX18_9GAMM|nr:lytic transglycosylase domain-containing protein [Colwelliaceae bacterium SQ149]
MRFNSSKIQVWLAVLALSGVLLIPKSLAETPLVYKYKSKRGIPSFSDIEPQNVNYKIVQVGCFACNVGSMVNWYKTPLNTSAYSDLILKNAFLHNVDPALIRAIIHAESHFKENAISKVGAQGLMQLMPATAKELGVKNSLNAEDNIQGGVKHLAKLLKKYRGNIKLVAAAYNAGEGAVKKYGGVPPYGETLVYVDRVKILHSRYRQTG